MKLRLNASSVAAGLAIGALAAGGITYAAGNVGSTTINACQMKSTGALRILTTGTCKATEVGVSWNSQGPQGDVGPQGAQGIQGAQGDRGPATYANSVEGLAKALAVNSEWVSTTGGMYTTGTRSYFVPGPVHLALQDVHANFNTSRGNNFGAIWMSFSVKSNVSGGDCATGRQVMSGVANDATELIDLGAYDGDVCLVIDAMSGNYSGDSSAVSARLIKLSPAQMDLAK